MPFKIDIDGVSARVQVKGRDLGLSTEPYCESVEVLMSNLHMDFLVLP